MANYAYQIIIFAQEWSNTYEIKLQHPWNRYRFYNC